MFLNLGCGYGSVGRAVASDTRDPRFKFSHEQILFAVNCIQNNYKLHFD